MMKIDGESSNAINTFLVFFVNTKWRINSTKSNRDECDIRKSHYDDMKYWKVSATIFWLHRMKVFSTNPVTLLSDIWLFNHKKKTDGKKNPPLNDIERSIWSHDNDFFAAIRRKDLSKRHIVRKGDVWTRKLSFDVPSHVAIDRGRRLGEKLRKLENQFMSLR